jgi:hypothetical protein
MVVLDVDRVLEITPDLMAALGPVGRNGKQYW